MGESACSRDIEEDLTKNKTIPLVKAGLESRGSTASTTTGALLVALGDPGGSLGTGQRDHEKNKYILDAEFHA